MPDKQNTAAMAHDVPMGDIELDPKAFEGSTSSARCRRREDPNT